MTISRNEQNTVYVNYGSDAEDAMLSRAFAKGQTSVVDVAVDVMRNDIGALELGSIDGIG